MGLLRRSSPNLSTTLRVGAILIGALRAVFGAVLVAVPDRSAERWVGASDDTRRTLVRSVGARDLVIGAGIVTAAVRDDRGVWPWLVASLGSDVVDGVEAVNVRVPDDRSRNAARVAFGFAALTVAAMAAGAATS